MAKWGKCDFSEFEKLKKRLDQMQGKDNDEFMRACVKDLAARLLPLVIKETPLGKHPKSTGKKGGTLRRGWTANTEEEAESNPGTPSAPEQSAYIKSSKVTKSGYTFEIEVFNPVHYAPYVEYGHRTPSKTGWVEGRFMLTKSEMKLAQQYPAILEKKLQAYLEELFNGQ